MTEMLSPDSPRPAGRQRRSLTWLPIFLALVTWLVGTQLFPFVDNRTFDVLMPIVLGLGISGASNRGRMSWAFLSLALVIGLLSAAVFSTLNAGLDRHASTTFAGVVEDKTCGKSACTWELKGSPDSAPIWIERLDWATLKAEPGDSLLLAIRPGFFKRPWIASIRVRQVERSQLACNRLGRAAAAGDTAELGQLLRQGLSIETDEPGMYCRTPLVAAAKAGQVAAVRFLLAHGANPNHASAGGQTPMDVALAARDTAVIRILGDAMPRTRQVTTTPIGRRPSN